jgi:hypothetical protein
MENKAFGTASSILTWVVPYALFPPPSILQKNTVLRLEPQRVLGWGGSLIFKRVSATVAAADRVGLCQRSKDL